MDQRPMDYTVLGINSYPSNINKQVKICISSSMTKFECNLHCLVIQKITEKLPIISFDKNILNLPPDVVLADPNFNVSSEIDLLMSASLAFQILRGEPISLGNDNLPIIHNTQFGWVVAGNLITEAISQNTSFSFCNTNMPDNVSNEDLQRNLTQFWEIEEDVKLLSSFSKEDQLCETFFSETVSREPSGKFIVKMPLKDNHVFLGDSEQMALRRFYSLEQKLAKNPQLKTQYSQFINEYKEMNHMSLVSKQFSDLEPGYYVPHHAVCKAEVLH
ncbi:hypothetical protein TcasGA2_TC000146 [Tribolium castaneum]|uniref:Uncharacterized protein n=1 Tax=Tribolium castaneum TaxID=7070 RepID=D7GY44_TRICA|nr:hypothetical protein TcasGA2_TC000146 [Tribolium castaneum]